jgi:hypothetical protein
VVFFCQNYNIIKIKLQTKISKLYYTTIRATIQENGK